MLRSQKVVVGIVTAVAIFGLGMATERAVTSSPESTASARQQSVGNQDVSDPTRGRTWDQVLDSQIEPGNMIGYVRGVVVGEAEATQLGTPPTTAIFSDFPFRVTGFYGIQNPGYRDGQLITLRIDGGTFNGVTQTSHGAPVVRPGETLYVIAFARAAFTWGEGDSSDRLVATNLTQVFDVHGNGMVSGRGLAAPLSESEQRFQEHFTNWPHK